MVQKNNFFSRSAPDQVDLIQRADEFENVFRTSGVMETDPFFIHLKDDEQPNAIMTARRALYPIYKKVKEEFRRLRRDHITVPMEDPSEWCALVLPVIKTKKRKVENYS